MIATILWAMAVRNYAPRLLGKAFWFTFVYLALKLAHLGPGKKTRKDPKRTHYGSLVFDPSKVVTIGPTAHSEALRFFILLTVACQQLCSECTYTSTPSSFRRHWHTNFVCKKCVLSWTGVIVCVTVPIGILLASICHSLVSPFPFLQVGLLLGTLAQTKAGPEVQEANTDRLKPLAYGALGRGWVEGWWWTLVRWMSRLEKFSWAKPWNCRTWCKRLRTWRGAFDCTNDMNALRFHTWW